MDRKKNQMLKQMPIFLGYLLLLFRILPMSSNFCPFESFGACLHNIDQGCRCDCTRPAKQLVLVQLVLVAARALATYLIPGCVGRGVRLGSENSSAGAGGVWKSGNVCWHQNWSEMGPYGSIWLDPAAKMIVRTLRIFFVFKKSLKIGLGVPQRGP